MVRTSRPYRSSYRARARVALPLLAALLGLLHSPLAHILLLLLLQAELRRLLPQRPLPSQHLRTPGRRTRRSCPGRLLLLPLPPQLRAASPLRGRTYRTRLAQSSSMLGLC